MIRIKRSSEYGESATLVCAELCEAGILVERLSFQKLASSVRVPRGVRFGACGLRLNAATQHSHRAVDVQDEEDNRHISLRGRM